MMRGVYEKDLLFFWRSRATASAADYVRMFNISRSQSLRPRTNSKPGGNCRHRRGSAKRVRRAPRPFAQPLLQHHASLCVAPVLIFLQRTFLGPRVPPWTTGLSFHSDV